MLHILLELFDFSQLKRARQGVLTELEKKLHECFSRIEPVTMSEANGTYILAFERLSYTNPSGIINTAFELHAVLDAFQDEISGFNILIEEHPGTLDQEVSVSLGRYIRTADEDCAIWMGEKAAPVLSPFVTYEKHEVLFKILEHKEKEQVIHGDLESFCRRTDLRERLLEELAALESASARPGFIRIRSNPLNCVHNSVILALELSPGNHENILIVHGSAAEIEPLDILLSSLPAGSIEKLEPFLEPDELRPWKIVTGVETCPQSSDTLHDSCGEDGVIRIRLHLQAFSRRIRKSGGIPILLLSRLERIPDASVALLMRCARELVERKELMLICITDSDRIPEPLKVLDVRELVIEPLSRTEVRERLRTGRNGQESSEEFLDAICTRTKGFLIPVFHCLKVLERNPSKTGRESVSMNPSEIAWDFLELNPVAVRDLLYAVALGREILSSELIESFLPFMNPGIPLSVTIRSLEAYGLLHDAQSLEEYYPEITFRISSRLKDREPEIRKRFSEYLYLLWKQHRIPSGRNLFSFILRYGNADQALEVLEAFLRNRLDRLLPNPLRTMAPQIAQLEQKLAPGRKVELEDILLSIQLREAVQQCRHDAARSLVEKKEKAPERDGYARIFVEEARFLSSQGEFRRALNTAKQALLRFQDLPAPVESADAGIELALIMLAEERLVEAKEYFSIVRHSVEKAGARYQLIRSIVCEAVAFFIFGNYTRALQDAMDAYAMAEKCGIRRFQLYMLLIIGRTLFELGLYDDALEKFEEGRFLAHLYSRNEPETVFGAWKARSLLYGGKPDESGVLLESLPQTREVLFFTAELYLETDRPEESIACADLALKTAEPKSVVDPGELISWDSGFASVENMFFRKADGNEVLTRLIRALKAFIRGRTTDTYASALAELYSLTRNEKLSEYDPYNYLYYYFYADILPSERDRSIDDRLTVMGKAVKYLQERMSRIEDTSDKSSYLTRNVWNNRLFQESRKNNLV